MNQKAKDRWLAYSSDSDSTNSNDFSERSRKTKKRHRARKLSTESESSPSTLKRSAPVIAQQEENFSVKQEPELNITQDDPPVMMMEDCSAAKDIDQEYYNDLYDFYDYNEFEIDIKSEDERAQSQWTASQQSSSTEDTEIYELDELTKTKHNINDDQLTDIEMNDMKKIIVPLLENDVDAEAFTDLTGDAKSDVTNGNEIKVADDQNEFSIENKIEVIPADDIEEENGLSSDAEVFEPPNSYDADNEEDDAEIQK